MSHLQLPKPIQYGILCNKIRELYDNIILTSSKCIQRTHKTHIHSYTQTIYLSTVRFDKVQKKQQNMNEPLEAIRQGLELGAHVTCECELCAQYGYSTVIFISRNGANQMEKCHEKHTSSHSHTHADGKTNG